MRAIDPSWVDWIASFNDGFVPTLYSSHCFNANDNSAGLTLSKHPAAWSSWKRWERLWRFEGTSWEGLWRKAARKVAFSPYKNKDKKESPKSINWPLRQGSQIIFFHLEACQSLLWSMLIWEDGLKTLVGIRTVLNTGWQKTYEDIQSQRIPLIHLLSYIIQVYWLFWHC